MHCYSRVRLFDGMSFVGSKRSLSCLVLFVACSAASGQGNLAQSNQKAALSQAARKVLQAALSGTIARTPVSLPSETAAPIIASLPKGFRNSCNDVVEGWPGAKDTDQWTVRVLFSLPNERGVEAVLALRCGSSNADMKEWYDERPAVIVLTPESGTLRLVPLLKECEHCTPFYHVEFTKSYSAAGTKLIELQAYYSHDNPCCDGTDHKEGNRLMVVSLPAGEQVLSMDQLTEANSVDDEAGTDTVWVCEAKFAYGPDAEHDVEMIRAETRCTVDKKPDGEVKKQSFHWNVTTHRFEEVK